jgi:hypothetical protein
MRLGGFVAVTILVLVVLVNAFPQTFTREKDNIDAHMNFTAKLAEHSVKLEAMNGVPERMARIEERLDGLGRMVWGILAGIAALLGKEVWSEMRALRTRRLANGTEVG